MREFQTIIVTQWQYGSVRAEMSPATWEQRLTCARELAIRAIKLGYIVVGVVDDISQPHFADTGAVLVISNVLGVGPPRRLGIRRAKDLLESKRGAIVWTEPEKVGIEEFIEKIVAPLRDGTADLVIVGRTIASLFTYVWWQIFWEICGNVFCYVIMGRLFDYFFTPRAFTPEVADFFLNYPGEEKHDDLWDSIHVPPMDMMAAGLRVAGVYIDFNFPPAQAAAEEGDILLLPKRTFALHNIVSNAVKRRLFLEKKGAKF